MRRLWILGSMVPLVGCGVMPALPAGTVGAPVAALTSALSAPSRVQSEYYPMAEDLRWIYEDGPLHSPMPRKRRATWFLDIRRGDQGVSFIGIQMRNQDRSGQVIHNNLGVSFAPQMGATVGPRHVLLKYPLLIGSSWDVVVSPEKTVRAKVDGIEPVTTPNAGTFARCFRIKLYEDTKGHTDYHYATRWVAPGVGLVRQYNHDSAGAVSSITRLHQFATGMAPSQQEMDATRELFGKHHFTELDVNHDKFLTAWECGPADLFEEADRDRNKKLDFGEFFASELYTVQIKRQLEQASREFWAQDYDFDMQTTFWELTRQALPSLPRKISEKDFEVVDQDENDKLSYREFHHLYQRLWRDTLRLSPETAARL